MLVAVPAAVLQVEAPHTAAVLPTRNCCMPVDHQQGTRQSQLAVDSVSAFDAIEYGRCGVLDGWLCLYAGETVTTSESSM